MIKKYRKLPVEIEAVKYESVNDIEQIKAFVGSSLNLETKDLFGNPVKRLWIETLEGDMAVTLGDYIIKGLNGEFYPCKPDIFERSYEFVGDIEIVEYNILHASIARRGINGVWPASVYYVDPETNKKIVKALYLKDREEAQEFMRLFAFYMVPFPDNNRKPSENTIKRTNEYLNKALNYK